MSNDGAKYVASLLSGITSEEIAVRMAQSFLRNELQTKVDRSQLAVVRQDEAAYYVAPATGSVDGVELRVAKDGSTVERV